MQDRSDLVIDIQQMVFAYDRENILDGVDLQLQRGTILGLLGENGAGKTTLMECLLGFHNPQSGSSQIFGESSRGLSAAVRQRLAFVPQINDLYPWMMALDVINYTSKFYASWHDQLVEKLLQDWEIPLHLRLKEMSVGEAQKLSIILAMGHQPDLLILDEPVASLDPSAKRAFIRKLIELNSELGSSILFSTHNTNDIERVAADVAIIRAGKTFFQGEIDELKERVSRIHVLAAQPLSSIDNINGLISTTITDNEAVITVENYSDALTQQLERQYSAKVTVQNMNLEDIFIALAEAA
jgi:ABC-2 type transport system ATP-binding protein